MRCLGSVIVTTGNGMLRAVGIVRLLVGVALIAAPRRIGRSAEPGPVLLMRTIGIRDLVIGAGTASAPDASVAAWGTAALASDSLDMMAGSLAASRIGVGGGLVAALAPLPFILVGAIALRRARLERRHVREADRRPSARSAIRGFPRRSGRRRASPG